LVDQKVRAATLFELELSPDIQEQAAVMLASCPKNRLSVNLDLLHQPERPMAPRVAAALASSLLLEPVRSFGHGMDDAVALGLLRAMKEQGVADGAIGHLQLLDSSTETPLDPFCHPDDEPPQNILAFVSAFGILKPNSEQVCRLSSAALLAACHEMKQGWEKTVPVLVQLLSKGKSQFDLEKVVKWMRKFNVDLNER